MECRLDAFKATKKKTNHNKGEAIEPLLKDINRNIKEKLTPIFVLERPITTFIIEILRRK